MMDLGTIRDLTRQATNKARRHKREPFVPTSAQRAHWYDGNLQAPGVHIPFLGDYVPKGWIQTDDDYLFADMSGFGAEDEPALSMRQLAKRMAAYPVGVGFALVEQGQFQGYIAAYRRK